METDFSRIEKNLAPLSRRFDSVPVAAFRSYATVVETGSFSAAARQIGVSVSTISKHVDMIEARLQLTLLLRTTRRMTVTEAGREFHEQCRRVLDRLDAVTEARLTPTGLAGQLSLIAAPSFARCVLSPALPRFLAAHPNLCVEVQVRTAPANFLKEGIDLAIRMTKIHSRSDRLEWIGPAPSALYASPDYLARHGTPRHPDALIDHQCLRGLNSPYDDKWLFKVDGEPMSFPIVPAFSSDMGDVLRDACLAGFGIAGFYGFHVREEVAAGRLVPVLTDYQADVSALYAVVPIGRYTPAKTTAFLAFLRELARDL